MLMDEFNPPISSWTAPGNTGRLVVDGASIEAWAEETARARALLMGRMAGRIRSALSLLALEDTDGKAQRPGYGAPLL